MVANDGVIFLWHFSKVSINDLYSHFYTIPTLESYKTGGFGMGKKLIRQVPMTKDVKVVKNIKKSVLVFVIFVQTAIYLRSNQYILSRIRILQLLGQTVPHRMKTSPECGFFLEFTLGSCLTLPRVKVFNFSR